MSLPADVVSGGEPRGHWNFSPQYRDSAGHALRRAVTQALGYPFGCVDLHKIPCSFCELTCRPPSGKNNFREALVFAD
jgi:hypothetical protein